jgi:hypothetical protein
MPIDRTWRLRDLGDDVTIEVTSGFAVSDGVARSSWELRKLLGRGPCAGRERARSVLLDVHHELFGPRMPRARRDDGYALEALRGDLESAVRAGWLVLRRTRPTLAILPLDPGEPASLGPQDEVAIPDDWIRVMLFDSAGDPMPSELEPAAEPAFDLSLATGKRIPDNALMSGFGWVPSIEPGSPSACTVAFPNMATRPPAKLDYAPPVGDPQIDPQFVRGPLLGPTLVTRKELANPQPALLDATNVFQLRRRRAEVIECEHFNERGAVFLPGDSPAPLRPDAARVQGIDVLKACLVRGKDVPVDRILVAGHHASVAEEMAKSVTYLLTAQRENWVDLSTANGTEADYRCILQWVAATNAWACEAQADAAPAVLEFQRAYNAELGAAIGVDGIVGPETWGAFFDMYMRALRPASAPVEGPPVRPGATYPIGDDATRSGANAGRPTGQYPFVLIGSNGPGNAPITIAKYGAGSETHYMELQPLNPQYRIGEEAEWIGQTLNVPWEWAPKLVDAGYTVEQDPVAPIPPNPPPDPGLDPLPAPGPTTVTCGAHHLTTPFSRDRNRRAIQRHVEVAFLLPGDPVPIVGCGAGDGPCDPSKCELYDPREYGVAYVLVGAVAAVVTVYDLSTKAPLAGTRVMLEGRTSAESTTDENGQAFFTVLPGTYRVLADHADYAENDAQLVATDQGGKATAYWLPTIDFLVATTPGDAAPPPPAPSGVNHVAIPLHAKTGVTPGNGDHQLVIIDNTTKLRVGRKLTTVVGRWVSFSVSGEGNSRITNAKWRVDGIRVQAYSPSNAQTLRIDLAAIHPGPSVDFFWIEGGTNDVTVWGSLDGRSYSRTFTVTVLAPERVTMSGQRGEVGLRWRLTEPRVREGLWVVYGDPTGPPGMKWTCSAHLPADGQIGAVQLLCIGAARAGRGIAQNYTSAGEWVLDTSFPYSEQKASDLDVESKYNDSDSPGNIVWASKPDEEPRVPRKLTFVKSIFQARTYFLYKPSGDSIWVALGRLEWNVSWEAHGEDHKWHVRVLDRNRDTIWIESKELPEWTRNVEDIKWMPELP